MANQTTEGRLINVLKGMDKQERARLLMRFARLFAKTHKKLKSGRWKSLRKPCQVYRTPRDR